MAADAGTPDYQPLDRARFLRPRHGAMDALVTLTIIGWLTATLALMVGELYRGRPLPEPLSAVASAATAVLPPGEDNRSSVGRGAPESL